MHNMLGNVLKDNKYLMFGLLTGFINISKKVHPIQDLTISDTMTNQITNLLIK